MMGTAVGVGVASRPVTGVGVGTDSREVAVATTEASGLVRGRLGRGDVSVPVTDPPSDTVTSARAFKDTSRSGSAAPAAMAAASRRPREPEREMVLMSSLNVGYALNPSLTEHGAPWGWAQLRLESVAMPVGEWVRRRLGPYEAVAAEAYRRPFINLDDLRDTLAVLPGVRRILEVGSGEGAVADRLCAAFPTATYLGVDIIGEPGRLFRGPRNRVEFRRVLVEDLPADDTFDMVLFVDVLHHVPVDQRRSILASAHSHVRRGGYLAVKDWEGSRSPMNALWFIADRYVAGDANIRSFAPGELRSRLRELFPDDRLALEARIPPCRNNVLIVLQRS
jgi:2-polyprenyl-3-methyl-5-hydroxy-6-metoxy-1,4-benzoquinol methylase